MKDRQVKVKLDGEWSEIPVKENVMILDAAIEVASWIVVRVGGVSH